jgi:protease PrsW
MQFFWYILWYAGAVLPSLLICAYAYRRDRYDKEPRIVLIISFLLGVLACVPAYIFERIGETWSQTIDNSLLQTFFFAFVAVAMTEEICKYIFLRLYCFNHKAFTEPLDGIVYSVMVSMGFAAFENIVYGISNDKLIMLVRVFTAVPAHAAFAVIMGYHLGLSKFENNGTDRRLAGLTMAIIAHGCYDFLLFQTAIEPLRWAAFILLFICVSYAWRLWRSLRADSLRRWRHKP